MLYVQSISLILAMQCHMMLLPQRGEDRNLKIVAGASESKQGIQVSRGQKVRMQSIPTPQNKPLPRSRHTTW